MIREYHPLSQWGAQKIAACLWRDRWCKMDEILTLVAFKRAEGVDFHPQSFEFLAPAKIG